MNGKDLHILSRASSHNKTPNTASSPPPSKNRDGLTTVTVSSYIQPGTPPPIPDGLVLSNPVYTQALGK